MSRAATWALRLSLVALAVLLTHDSGRPTPPPRPKP